MAVSGLMLLGTESKVGKTYVAVLLLQALQRARANPGYFKILDTGARSIEMSDAAQVKASCRLGQELSEMVPYVLPQTGPAYLAVRAARLAPSMAHISQRYGWNVATHSHMIVEGIGELLTPLMCESNHIILQQDIATKLKLGLVLVVKMSASALSHTSLAVHYLKSIGQPPVGIIINGYNERVMAHRDALVMIERFTQTKVIATVARNQRTINCLIPITELFAQCQAPGSNSQFDYDEENDYGGYDA